MLDSHSDLIRYFELPDTQTYHQHFAKVELTPADTEASWLDASTWAFRLDQATAPGWWEDVQTSAEDTLRARAQAMIVTTGRKDLILNGCWILGGDVEWQEMRGGRIMRMGGSARIHRVSGSAQIHRVWDSAQIYAMWDSAQIIHVGGSARIHRVGGSAQIHGVGGSAQIHEVWGLAQIHRVWDSAQIHDVSDSAQIHDVSGLAQIHDVSDSARLSDSAKAHVVQKGGTA